MKLLEEKLGNIEFEHRLWMIQLDFALKEMALYENRLIQLTQNDKEPEKVKQANDLIQTLLILKGQVNQLQNQIRRHIITTQNKIQSNGSIDALVNSTHIKTQIQMDVFTENYDNLKKKFHEFFILQN